MNSTPRPRVALHVIVVGIRSVPADSPYAGIATQKFTTAELRHSFASRALALSTALPVVGKLLGIPADSLLAILAGPCPSIGWHDLRAFAALTGFACSGINALAQEGLNAAKPQEPVYPAGPQVRIQAGFGRTSLWYASSRIPST